MHSLRTKLTILTIFVVVISISLVTCLSVLFIRSSERRESEQLLLLLCETGKSNLDYYFDSVHRSVEKVARFTERDLDGLEAEKLEAHMRRVGSYFDEIAHKTNGVLTYYYRIDPEVSDTVKGFWYTNLDGDDFVEHEVTDITLYDTQDTSKLVWFTVPKHDDEPIWLPPYITDNLDVRVISYNMPIHYHGRFVGVVGIEIDYSTMAKQVESIRLYNNGYAFLSDEDADLFFHPRIDVSQLTEETMPAVPEEMHSSSTFVRYTFDGVEKQAAWLPLSNGMRLVITVPISETEGEWQTLVREILIASVLILLTMSLITMYYTRRFTSPLQKLTQAAELVDGGNYDFTLEYNGDDEIGKLTKTFRNLAEHMKVHISDLSNRVYVDALTSVKNKGAFSGAIEDLQKQMDEQGPELQFAVGVFDCDDLKSINDRCGHDKGDLYLKTACHLICKVFQHSPVFRIGGDEFAVILRNDDFQNRDELVRRFDKEAEAISGSTAKVWEQVHVALGIAVYDPAHDNAVIDTVRRADKTMYMNKRSRKRQR